MRRSRVAADDAQAHAIGPLQTRAHRSLAASKPCANILVLFIDVLAGGVAEESARSAEDAAGASAPAKLRVFISYSRDDLAFADQLVEALEAYGFEPLIDRQGIAGGEDWKRRLSELIAQSDTVAFVLSPRSAASPTANGR